MEQLESKTHRCITCPVTSKILLKGAKKQIEFLKVCLNIKIFLVIL
jgi:hypothetical protein